MSNGKTEILLSGAVTTNSFSYTSKFHVLGFAKYSVFIEGLASTASGAEYTVRGYPDEDATTAISLGSGTYVISGTKVLLTSGLDVALASIDVGVKNAYTNGSSVVTVIVAGARR